QDASELVTNGLMRQQRSDRGVDAARKGADDLAGTDLGADRFHCLLAIGGHCPVALEAGNAMYKIGNQLGAVGRVHDFGVKLDAVILALVIGDCRKRRAWRSANNTETFGESGDAVAMAHPHLVACARRPKALKQCAAIVDIEEGASKLAMVARLHLATKLGAEKLLAIADAEDWQA